jgi:hypothetical protein
MRYRSLLLALLLPAPLAAQKVGGSANVHALGHVPIGTILSVGDIEIEQELSRPYAYISRINYSGFKGFGFHIISIANPSEATLHLEYRAARAARRPGRRPLRHPMFDAQSPQSCAGWCGVARSFHPRSASST